PPAKSERLRAAFFRTLMSALALNTSRFEGMRLGGIVGPGEIAIVAATGSRSAMRIAIEPPMEWPTRIVVLGFMAPAWISASTAAVAQSCARRNENLSLLSP